MRTWWAGAEASLDQAYTRPRPTGLRVKSRALRPPGPLFQRRPTCCSTGLSNPGPPGARETPESPPSRTPTFRSHRLEATPEVASQCSGRSGACEGAWGKLRELGGGGVEWPCQPQPGGDLGALTSTCTPESRGLSKFRSPRGPGLLLVRRPEQSLGAGQSPSRGGRADPARARAELGAPPSAAPAAGAAEEEPRPDRRRPGSSSPRGPGPSSPESRSADGGGRAGSRARWARPSRSRRRRHRLRVLSAPAAMVPAAAPGA